MIGCCCTILMCSMSTKCVVEDLDAPRRSPYITHHTHKSSAYHHIRTARTHSHASPDMSLLLLPTTTIEWKETTTSSCASDGG